MPSPSAGTTPARGWPGGSPRRGAVAPARAGSPPPPAPRPPSARRGSPSRPGRSGTPRPGAGRSSPRRAPVTATVRGPARGWRAAALRRPGGRSGSPCAARVPAGPAAARRRPGPAGRGAPATNRSTRSPRNWTLPGTTCRRESRSMTTAALAPGSRPHRPPAAGHRPVRPALRRRLPGHVQLLHAARGRPVSTPRRKGVGGVRGRADHRRARCAPRSSTELGDARLLARRFDHRRLLTVGLVLLGLPSLLLPAPRAGRAPGRLRAPRDRLRHHRRRGRNPGRHRAAGRAPRRGAGHPRRGLHAPRSGGAPARDLAHRAAPGSRRCSWPRPSPATAAAALTFGLPRTARRGRALARHLGRAPAPGPGRARP